MGNNSAERAILAADRVLQIPSASRRDNQSLYSLFDPAHLLACQEREAAILRALLRQGHRSLEKAKLLEIGCGTGFWLREFVRWGARPENITGIDVRPEKLAKARILCPQEISLGCQDATALSFSSDAFDLVFQSTVFTSILDEDMKKQIAAEMLRVLRPGGIVIWYDFTVNNPRNPNVRGVPRREVMRLFPGCRIEFRRLTLAPPVARRIARISGFLYRILQFVRILDTHCLAIIHKTC